MMKLSSPAVAALTLTAASLLMASPASAAEAETKSIVEVYLDKDKDGRRDDGELGLSGYPVKLYGEDKKFVKQEITDATGTARFSVPAGQSFSIRVSKIEANGDTDMKAWMSETPMGDGFVHFEYGVIRDDMRPTATQTSPSATSSPDPSTAPSAPAPESTSGRTPARVQTDDNKGSNIALPLALLTGATAAGLGAVLAAPRKARKH